MSEQLSISIQSEASPVFHDGRRGGRFRIEEWVVDPASNQLTRDQFVSRLEPKVMEVLVYLAHRAGEVVTREDIEAEVWAGTVVGYDSVTNAVQKLRKAFHDDPKHPRFIETFSKRGYRLVATVHTLDNFPVGVETSAIPDVSEPVVRSWWSSPILYALLVPAMILVTGLWWVAPRVTTEEVPPVDIPPQSIAVMPFENLGTDSEQEYFSDGITDDLITELAKRPDLLVIARDSTFVYKNQPLDVNRIADELNVRFMLRGSVRREGEQVRVNAQLIDTHTESNLWAERYDGDINNIFGLQDEITRKIVSSLTVKVSSGEQQELGQPLTNNPEAYDNFLYGRQRFFLYANKSENEKAREFFKKAIGFDADFAMAHAMLAWTHAFDAMNGWSETRQRSLQVAQASAEKAISLQEVIPLAYFIKGLVYREQGEYVQALVEAQKAIEYDPNYANAHVLLATLLYYAGRPQEGLERIQKAMQLNPRHPYNYTFHLGQAYFILRRYGEAIAAFQNGIDSNPAAERLHVWLAAAYAQADDAGEAEWEADQVLTLNPEFTVKRMKETFPFKNPADREHFLDGLRKAGLPQQ